MSETAGGSADVDSKLRTINRLWLFAMVVTVLMFAALAYLVIA